MGLLEAAPVSGPTDSDDIETPGCPKDRFDPDSFARFESYLWQLDRVALDRTTFLRELHGDRQHLDLGCGTGGFTRDVLLPLCGPDTRIVGADISPAMLHIARRNNAQGRILYDLLDINSDVETSAFRTKYGQFERVYSVLCFHMVKDQTAAFRSIGHLLSTKGECLVTAVVTNPAMDTWLDLQRMPEWRNLIPDPRTVLTSSAVHFHYSGTRDQIEEETRQCATDAGLECIACEVIDWTWFLHDVGHFCDMYTAAFLMDVNLEPHRRDALIAAYTEILQTRMKKTPSGWELTVGIYRVHARLR